MSASRVREILGKSSVPFKGLLLKGYRYRYRCRGRCIDTDSHFGCSYGTDFENSEMEAL